MGWFDFRPQQSLFLSTKEWIYVYLQAEASHFTIVSCSCASANVWIISTLHTVWMGPQDQMSRNHPLPSSPNDPSPPFRAGYQDILHHMCNRWRTPFYQIHVFGGDWATLTPKVSSGKDGACYRLGQDGTNLTTFYYPPSAWLVSWQTSWLEQLLSLSFYFLASNEVCKSRQDMRMNAKWRSVGRGRCEFVDQYSQYLMCGFLYDVKHFSNQFTLWAERSLFGNSSCWHWYFPSFPFRPTGRKSKGDLMRCFTLIRCQTSNSMATNSNRRKFNFLVGSKAQILILGSLDPIMCLLRMSNDDSKWTTSRMDYPRSPEEGVLHQLIVWKLRPLNTKTWQAKVWYWICSRTAWPAFTILAPFLPGVCMDLVHKIQSVSISTVCRGLVSFDSTGIFGHLIASSAVDNLICRLLHLQSRQLRCTTPFWIPFVQVANNGLDTHQQNPNPARHNVEISSKLSLQCHHRNASIICRLLIL